MTIDLSPEAEAALNRIASMSTFRREELVTHAMESYANWLAHETARIEEARADIAAGRVLSHEEVFRQLDAEFMDDDARVD
jgi:predicted transcriptional regulator